MIDSDRRAIDRKAIEEQQVRTGVPFRSASDKVILRMTSAADGNLQAYLYTRILDRLETYSFFLEKKQPWLTSKIYF